ncbi:hypothetical protein [Pseudomonas syringae]|uniref:hypothetical protein n=1 Tax=Pseudomonas syringae TaxID=317 RepID=UPI000C08BC7D|nr:hypothetical protein [Pseudomonas syringae]PHN23306.1 hypothetical protein AO256_24860 [Pseudomonas syringae]
MDIRDDFRSVETWLQRLSAYARAFSDNNRGDWSHLRNQEDFSRVYSFPASERVPLENLYAHGRDLAVAMSDQLTRFNWIQEYPTLKLFVDSFDRGWVNQLDLLEVEVSAAETVAAGLQNCPWAVSEMIKLYRSQMNLLASAGQCLEMLRKSDLYVTESGYTAPTPGVMAYSSVLQSIESVGKMFERLPSTYAEKGEEALRDHLLVTLDAVVGGGVTGETFNKRGKTDILVRNEGDTCFVGECKFWTGRSGFKDTIDQLLSYLSWRDTNTAVIFFVRNKEFSSVVDKANVAAQSHSNFIRKTSQPSETWGNFEFFHPDDMQRVIRIAIMLYHLP